MKKLLYKITAGAVVVSIGMMVAPQPAFAIPTCEQEMSIRCSGYSVQGRPRLDIYYDSYEECVEAETARQCPYWPAPPPPRALSGRDEMSSAWA